MKYILTFISLIIFSFSCGAQPLTDSIKKNLLYVTIPLLNPAPCSQYLLKFKSNKWDVIAKAKQENLVYIGSIAYPNDTASYILQYSGDTTNQTIVIAFVFNKLTDTYTGVMGFIRFNDIQYALGELEVLKQDIQKNWGVLNPNKNYKVAKCPIDGTKRIVNFNTSGKNSTLYISVFVAN